MSTVRIASFLDTSTVDYPGELSAVLWLSGCPFRCGFCQNATVATGEESNTAEVSEVLDRIRRVRPFIDALTVTGGEPTLQGPALLEILKGVKEMGLLTHINTNGFYPDTLETLLPFLDYVSIDVKDRLDPDAYGRTAVTDGEKAVNNLKKSLSILKSSDGITVEVRTTVVPGLNDSKDTIEQIAREISWADVYVLRRFCDQTVLDKRFKDLEPLSTEKVSELELAASPYVKVKVT